MTRLCDCRWGFYWCQDNCKGDEVKTASDLRAVLTDARAKVAAAPMLAKLPLAEALIGVLCEELVKLRNEVDALKVTPIPDNVRL